MKTSVDELRKIIEELLLMKKMVELMPQEETVLTLEKDDKRSIGEIDLSKKLKDLSESFNETLDDISEKMEEVYKNAVNDREGYPEDSTAKRALWLDDVESEAWLLKTYIEEQM